jgi:predicted MPP superfamily phosphohydrolase
VRAWGRRLIRSRAARWGAGLGALALYLLTFASNVYSGREIPSPTRMTLRDAVVVAPFLWWIFSSTVAFGVVVLIWLVRLPDRFLRARLSKSSHVLEDLPSPARRQFLERAASATVAVPFVAGAYGLLWGRLNLEVTRQPIRLARLPRAFHGFRIAQLSDIHVGPFMSEDEIRKYVNIANSLKVDMVALTGDFVTWDAATEQAVVNALSGLKAPFGVYGCLGNHDAWADAEDSMSALFSDCGIHILRQANVPIRSGSDSFNLMGIDFANSRNMSVGGAHMASQSLEGIEKLMAPDTANILLSHNPETFPRAAELGIDLSLAGHTHGGQLALEFISPELAPTRIVTPYVAGWFERPGGQLYVNRGIGTIAAPMRVGAPPEITVYELTRA